MQYFDCCPRVEGDGTDETTLTTRRFSTKLSINATSNKALQNRRFPVEYLAIAPWNTENYNSPVNPYHVLELRRDATSTEITRSYRKLALINHPGRKTACPLERKKRMQYFEVLAACYETLMHSEFRRKCDVLLKDIEIKQKSKANDQTTNSHYEGMTIRSQPPQILTEPHTEEVRNTNVVMNEVDSIPGLIPSTSQSSSNSGGERSNHCVQNSGESPETVPTNNCTSISHILTCVAGPGVLEAKTSSNNSFTISRDGTKGFKSLVDSSSLSVSHSQGSTEEEAEMHFSEATVNRLFGGPLASLHRARNFQAFSDPYLIFDKVFGNQKSIFPRVSIADVNAGNGIIMDDIENYGENGSSSLVRSSTAQFSLPGSERFSTSKKNHSKKNKESFLDNHANALTMDTKVFVSSRVVNGRKITKTETVHVNTVTGTASVNVTVDGEYLEPIRSRKKPSQFYESSVADWLLCFGTAKVVPSSRHKATQKSSSLLRKPSASGVKNENVFSATTDKDSNSFLRFKSVYIEALEEFYLCNGSFYDECNKYMHCGA